MKTEKEVNMTPNGSEYWELDWHDQIMDGRTIEKVTVDWWRENELTVPRGKKCPLEFFHELCEFCKINEIERYWFRGPQFDCVKLESLASDWGTKVPWKYNQVRDCRTLDDFCERREQKKEVSHHALEDATEQALDVVHAMEKINCVSLTIKE